MFFKSSSEPPSPDSDVDSDTFMLGIQTPSQRKCFRTLGHDFTGLDATHNMMYYNGMLLLTVIVHDRQGHEELYMDPETLKLWSAVYCKDRTVFLILICSLKRMWRHVLKGSHMDGKRNRHVDQLIHTLINVALPSYIANHRAQQFGFHGPDIALQKRNSIHTQAAKIKWHWTAHGQHRL
ncbi:hypothetical protein B0H17DRAFT_1203460 [Mycena rosella]|uniref:Uncharacterized protein n=1 Tax=Mycena rosella TaxID=1033263 RepID=A0AAD7GC89_MYCRO|nr:hypothetical protein B0H17DRAFT_1203460 [Mycena rosella]